MTCDHARQQEDIYEEYLQFHVIYNRLHRPRGPEHVLKLLSTQQEENMGACWQTLMLPANLTEAQVKERFHKVQQEDRHENGHSYSGGFGMASGIKLLSAKFPTLDEADDYLTNKAKKWEEALGVKCKTEEGNEVWYIGAWCSS